MTYPSLPPGSSTQPTELAVTPAKPFFWATTQFQADTAVVLRPLDMSGVFPSVIGLSFTTFLLTMLVSLALASLTVGVRTVQAALANPVNSLRSE